MMIPTRPVILLENELDPRAWIGRPDAELLHYQRLWETMPVRSVPVQVSRRVI